MRSIICVVIREKINFKVYPLYTIEIRFTNQSYKEPTVYMCIDIIFLGEMYVAKCLFSKSSCFLAKALTAKCTIRQTVCRRNIASLNHFLSIWLLVKYPSTPCSWVKASFTLWLCFSRHQHIQVFSSRLANTFTLYIIVMALHVRKVKFNAFIWFVYEVELKY